MRRAAAFAMVLPAVVALVLSACGSGCRYDPRAAKATFDGRTGEVALLNRGGAPVRVVLYHPDGDGSAEAAFTVEQGSEVLADESGPWIVGNDWGIAIDGGCPTTVGEAASEYGVRFVVEWPAPVD